MTDVVESRLAKRLSDDPLVSVIIATRNQSVNLHDSLASLCAQSYTHWEAIVVNDAGHDVSGLVDRFGKSGKIKYINLSSESGMMAAINAGLRFSNGELICYIDAGDTWRSDHLETVKTEILINNLQAVHTLADSNDSVNKPENIPVSTVSHRIELLGKTSWFGDGGGADTAGKFIHQLAEITDFRSIKKETVHRDGYECGTTEALYKQSALKQYMLKGTGNENPLVSIIVPTCNRAHLLKNALASIVSQDYGNWEAIVVNDAGEDAEAVALSADFKGRIVYISHDTNKGPSAARNTAIAKARGEIICYLDDDDVFLPMHIKTLVNALLNSDAGVVYSDSEHALENQLQKSWQQISA